MFFSVKVVQIINTFPFCISANCFLLNEQNLDLKVIRHEIFTMERNTNITRRRLGFVLTAHVSKTTTAVAAAVAAMSRQLSALL